MNKCAQFFSALRFCSHLGQADTASLNIHYKHISVVIIVEKKEITSGPWSSSSSTALCNFTGFFKPPWQHVWHPLHQRHVGTLLPCGTNGAEALSTALPKSTFPPIISCRNGDHPSPPSPTRNSSLQSVPSAPVYPHFHRSLILHWDPSFPSCTSSTGALILKHKK